MHKASFGLAFHDKAAGFSDQEVEDLRYLARRMAEDQGSLSSPSTVSGLLLSCILAGEVPGWAKDRLARSACVCRAWDRMPSFAAVANPTEEG